MRKILLILDEDATQARLLTIVREINALPPQQMQMQKMARLLPAAQELSAPVLDEYGFTKEQFMLFAGQLQMHATSSSAVNDGVARLMGVMNGAVGAGLGKPPIGVGARPDGTDAAAAELRVPTELQSEAFDARCDLTIRPQNLCDMQIEKCDQLIGSVDDAAITSAIKHTRTRFGGHIDVQVSLTALRVYQASRVAKAAVGADAAKPTETHTAVLGALSHSQLGARIAAELLSLGHHVHIYDDAGVRRVKPVVSDVLYEAQSVGLISESDAAAAFRRLEVADDIREAVRDSQLICECVDDTLPAKEPVYAEVVRYCRTDAVFGTSASELPLDTIQALLPEPWQKRLIGLRFVWPILGVSLVEVCFVKQHERDYYQVSRAETKEVCDIMIGVGKTVVLGAPPEDGTVPGPSPAICGAHQTRREMEAGLLDGASFEQFSTFHPGHPSRSCSLTPACSVDWRSSSVSSGHNC